MEEGKKAGAFTAASADVVLGANDRAGLAKLNEKARGRVISRLLAEGADIPCADGVLIGPDVTVGPDSCILPATVLCGKTAVGAGCRIGPAVRLANCKVEDGAAVSCCDKENETIV